MSTPSIRRVSHSEILCADNARELIAEYAAECSIPGAEPQADLYAALEQGGLLACFGAYIGRELVGLVSVVNTVMPHNGKRIATIESLFVAAGHRDSCAFSALTSAARQQAVDSGCTALLYTARVGSQLETILTHRAGCHRSHTIFTEWL